MLKINHNYILCGMIYPNPKPVSYFLSECGIRLVRRHGGWIEGLVVEGWIDAVVVTLSQCGDWNTVIIDDRLKKTTVQFTKVMRNDYIHETHSHLNSPDSLLLFKHLEQRYHDAK